MKQKQQPSNLSQEQLKSFQLDGFLVLRGFFDETEMEDVSIWIDQLSSQSHETGKQMNYFEDSLITPGQRILSRIEYFADYHDAFKNFILGERLVGVLSNIFSEPPVLFKEKINFKLPGAGGFAPHQDIQPGWDEYCPYFISVLVTVDKSTEENGCLELCSGHHNRGMIGKKWQALEGVELEGLQFKKFPMDPGDIAIFDCFVPHQSAPNLTSTQRRNLYLTYNKQGHGDQRRRYFEDKRISYPPDNERSSDQVYKFKV